MSEPASSPRRTINDLPTELKQRIVELCAEQDERYQHWVDGMDTSGKVELASLAKRNARVGRSVGSIFQVSKTFSTLAAPYIFKVLKSSRMNIHFRCLVSTTRLPLFSSLHIDSPDVTEAIIVLPRLSNLKHLVLQDDYHAFASSGPLDSPAPSLPVAGYAASAFKGVTGLASLAVRNLHLPYLAQLLALWAPTLSKLDLRYSLDHFDGIDCLAPALATATQLEELHLTFLYDDEDDVADLSSLQQGIPNYPPVARLFLQPEILHSSHLTFANSFSSSLTHLSLASTLNNGGDPFHHTMPRFTSEVFPSVSSLTVKGEHPIVKSTIDSIQARHFPSLTSFTLDISHVSDWPTALSFLPRLPSLATLSIPALRELPNDQSSIIRTLAAEHGLQLRSNSISDAPKTRLGVSSPSADGEDTSLPTLDSKCDAVQTTLEYVQERLQGARDAGEEDFVSRVATALRTFELERAAAEVWSKM